MIQNTTFSPQTKGFTIVELLIVLVVMSVLAGVALTTYKGMQDRAYNTKLIASVENYLDVLEVYHAKHGMYPKTARETAGERIALACLGVGYTNHACGRVSDVDIEEDESLEAQLQLISGSSEVVSSSSLPSGSETFVGVVYGNDTTDPSGADGYTYARTVQYALRGEDTDCKVPSAWSYQLTDSPPVTACEIVLEGLEQ